MLLKFLGVISAGEHGSLMKKQNGFSLIDIVISMGLVMVVFAGFAQVLQLYVLNQKDLDFADRKQDILVTTINLINNDYAWQKTVDFLGNTSMDCLKDKGKFPAISNAGNCLATDGGKFSLLDEAGNVYLDNAVATSGFSLSSGPCNSYVATGDDFCSLRAEVSWRPLCVTCNNNQVEITIELKDTPLYRKNIQGPLISRKIVRYAGYYDPDLVLFLKLDGPVTSTAPLGTVISDISGFKNHGTVAEWAAGGIPPTYFAGKTGQGLSFDTTPDTWKWISIPDSPSLRPTTITVAAWVNWTGALPIGFAGIVDKVNQTQSDSYLLSIRSYAGVQVFNFCVAEAPASPLRCIGSDVSPAKNTWYHVVGTWDGATIKMYVNGVLQSSTINYSGPNYWSTEPVLIGAENQTGWGEPNPYRPAFPGIIDQVKIWRRALRPAEILKEYNNP